MELLVDFNMVEADGRIPARIPLEQASAFLLGDEVVAEDGEGTRCRAVIDEIAPSGRYVMIRPLPGTARAAS